MSDTETDLAAAAADLASTLEALRNELHEPPRGPLGLPRPPDPNDLLAFTEQYTIPALVAVFETNIRLLELLAAAIRLAQGRPVGPDAEARLKASEFAVAGGREGVDRLAAASRTTLRKLDDALADLQDAAEGTPENPEAERLLRQARELRADIDERLAETADSEATADRTAIDVRGTDGEADADADRDAADTETGDDSDDDADPVDVDAELRSLKDEVGTDDDDETPNRE
jgi:predicted Zn-dependent protease